MYTLINRIQSEDGIWVLLDFKRGSCGPFFCKRVIRDLSSKYSCAEVSDCMDTTIFFNGFRPWEDREKVLCYDAEHYGTRYP